MSERTDWQLRYRSPISPTKGVDDVTVQTNSNDPVKAKEVADHWLTTKMAHPGTRFVFIRPVVVQTEDDMRREVAQKAAPVQEGQTAQQAADQRGKALRVGA